MDFVSACSSVTEEEMETFWSELSRCVEDRKGGGSHAVAPGDLNARVGIDEVLDVKGMYGVPRNNISEERLLEMSSEIEMV